MRVTENMYRPHAYDGANNDGGVFEFRQLKRGKTTAQ
jgi:hypothetical protein